MKGIVTKPNIKKHLNAAYVKIDHMGKQVSYKPNDTRITGIKVCSHSPTDISSKTEVIAKALQQAVTSLTQLGLEVKSNYKDMCIFTANKGTPKQFEVVLRVERYPTYSQASGYDQDYKSTWIVLTYN